MPKKEPWTKGSVGAASGYLMSWVLERPLAPKYLHSGSGNPSRPFESHGQERLPPEALVSSHPWDRQLTAGLRVVKDRRGGGGGRG